MAPHVSLGQALLGLLAARSLVTGIARPLLLPLQQRRLQRVDEEEEVLHRSCANITHELGEGSGA
jgi:hypothetical protein